MDLVRRCSDGSEILTKQGRKKAYGDMEDRKIYLKPPQGKPWAPSLDCVGSLCRIWGEVEENLYPRKLGFKGRNFLLQFIKLCITKPHWTIEQCCYEMKIPGYEDKDGLSLSSDKERQRQLGFTDIGLRVILFIFLFIEAFKR